MYRGSNNHYCYYYYYYYYYYWLLVAVPDASRTTLRVPDTSPTKMVSVTLPMRERRERG